MQKDKMGIPLKGFSEFSRKVAAEGAVLLKNEGQILPILEGESISVFGRCQIDYYSSGTGSGGSVTVEYTSSLLDGLAEKNININKDLVSIYEKWVEENPFDDGGGGWAAEPWHQEEMLLTDVLVAEARKKSDKAIVVIGRTAGEDYDNSNEPGSYLLTEEEKIMIKLVSKHFKRIALVLNVSNIIDMNWINEDSYEEPIPCVIYAWQGGIEGGNGIADVLVGDVTPSGKLTDTIAYSIDDYPSSNNYGDDLKNLYQEDIYLGYRYFETFHPEKVQFEFGYGMSYTEFEISSSAFRLVNDYIEIDCSVKNIGTSYSGKEVVQVYYEAPQGKLGKPARQLIAFKKTKELKVGESQSFTISFPVNQMASYDDGGKTGYPSALVLESGQYNIYIGNSVKNLKQLVAADGNATGYVVDKTTVVEQLEEALAPREAFTRMKPGQRKEDGTYEIVYEEVPQATISIENRIKENLPKDIKQTGDKGYKLKDVYDGKVSMETFIGQLNDKELATIVRGEGMSSPYVTPGTASAFGGVSDSLFTYGIPIGCCADGPSGIRMESGLKATQIPIGTLIAATWNIEMIEELYVWQAKEMLNNNIDFLLGPGMNIRRSPLNGRNFEYFSEDPLITGDFAAAVMKGLKKGGANGTLKHFACNNQEKSRHNVDAVVSERALREIYLKAFEIPVKDGNTNAIMTAYNPVNGYWTASSYDLNTTILRKQWGFEGMVMTDWWAKMNDVIDGGQGDVKLTGSMVRSQNDVYMVVNNYGAEDNASGDNTMESLEDGSLSRGELQRSAMNICKVLMESPVFFRKQDLSEIVELFKAGNDLKPELAQDISEDPIVKITKGKANYIKVKESGIYSIYVKLRSSANNLSQTTCNVMINGQLMMTIQVTSTEGQWVTRQMSKINTEEGLYEIELDFVKSGIEIDWIEFRR